MNPTARVDLHGLYPDEPELSEVIENALRMARDNGQREVRFIHGHGFGRGYNEWRNSKQTGRLGNRVRGILHGDMREYIFVSKTDKSNPGQTIAVLR